MRDALAHVLQWRGSPFHEVVVDFLSSFWLHPVPVSWCLVKAGNSRPLSGGSWSDPIGQILRRSKKRSRCRNTSSVDSNRKSQHFPRQSSLRGIEAHGKFLLRGGIYRRERYDIGSNDRMPFFVNHVWLLTLGSRMPPRRDVPSLQHRTCMEPPYSSTL